ncbi:MAG: hypothetical protein HGB31_02865 [Erysipelotrichaceae bacterium]|nr:hypothetical protein [Erysipelotrichaceae bacterium]
MKRTILTLVIFCVLLFSEISSVSASTDLSLSIKSLLAISTEVSGDSLLRKANLKSVKSYLDRNGVGQVENDEIIDYVFSELGYSAEQIQLIGYEELARILTESVYIKVIEQYVKVSKDGSIDYLSKKQCFESILQVKQYENQELNGNAMLSSEPVMTTSATSPSNTSYHYYWSKDGYMKILTTAYYLDPNIQGGIGYYTLSGTYTWLIIPNARLKDAFSIATNNGKTAWQLGDEDMSSRMQYTMKTNNNGSITTKLMGPYIKYKQDQYFSPNSGVYYTWDLPIDTFNWVSNIRKTVTSLSMYISAKARVSTYNESQEFNVFTVYQHAHPVINLGYSFSWNLGSQYPGVGVSLSPGIENSEYDGVNLISYHTDGH